MNRYTITFYFKNEWQFITMTANEMANALLDSSDDISDFVFNNEGQNMERQIIVEGAKYDVVFALNNPKCVSVYHADEPDGDGTLVEKDIPWLLLKIENKETEVEYLLTDYI